MTQSDGKGETKRLTSGSATYYNSPIWSPDSEKLLFFDKAGNVHLHTLKSGETKVIDRDPRARGMNACWSHDSRWITYARITEECNQSSIWLYDVEGGEATRVTSDIFSDSSPTFDRKGDYLYFTSGRSFSPTYSDVDSTFVYHESGVVLAVPLRKDVKSPWLPESDEVTFKDDDAGRE